MKVRGCYLNTKGMTRLEIAYLFVEKALLKLLKSVTCLKYIHSSCHKEQQIYRLVVEGIIRNTHPEFYRRKYSIY